MRLVIHLFWVDPVLEVDRTRLSCNNLCISLYH